MKSQPRFLKGPNGELLQVDVVTLQSALLRIRSIAEATPNSPTLAEEIIEIVKTATFGVDEYYDCEETELEQIAKSGQI